MGLARLDLYVTIVELRCVHIRFVFVELRTIVVVVVVVDVRLVLPTGLATFDDDGLIASFVFSDHRRHQQERVRRAARLAAAVNVFGPHAKLISPFGRQAVNHVRGRIAPVCVFNKSDEQ